MLKAILTGHSRGLGAAVAEALLGRGIALLAIARRRHAALAARHSHLTEVTLDLADPAALAAWLDGGELARFLAGADTALLVNNAGVVQPMAPVGAQDAAAIARAVSVNVTAPLQLANAFVAATAGCPDRRILHVSSGAGRKAYPGWSVYGATKAALDHHARTAAVDGIPGLRVASLAPGVIDTDMQAEIRATSPERFPLRPRFDALKAEGGLDTPAHTAGRLVAYLLSEEFGDSPEADLRTLPATD